MRLLNILQQLKSNLLSIILAVLVGFICLSPIIRDPLNAIYYSIDPDIVYLANALSNVKYNIVGYYDHPGTIAISLITLSFAPLRFYAKYIEHQGFITWAFTNYDFILLYTRIFVSTIYSLGIFVLSKSLFSVTKSKLSQIFQVLLLGCYLPFYFAGVSVSAEPFSLFLISIWIFVFSIYYQNKKIKLWFLLMFLSGILFSNRATNFFYMPASLILIYFTKVGDKSSINFKNVFSGLFLLASGFVIGLLPLGNQIGSAIKRVFFFASSTGVHGSGEQKLFEISSYIESIKIFPIGYSVITLVFLLVSFFAIYKMFVRKSNDKIFWISTLVFIFGSLVFAKFPLAHYQTGNLIFVIFIASYLYSKFNFKMKIIILILVLFKAIPIYTSFDEYMTTTSKSVKDLKIHQANQPAKTGTVWEWARYKDFSLIWTRNWGSNVFDDELSKTNPKIYELVTGFNKIKINSSDQKNVFDVCWDKLYIQKSSLDSFLKIHKDRKLIVEDLLNTENIVSISSNHCFTKL